VLEEPSVGSADWFHVIKKESDGPTSRALIARQADSAFSMSPLSFSGLVVGA
jgi:hypothetical protein